MVTANPTQVQAFLGGIRYPARRDDLVDYARAGDADEDIISTLQSLPDDDFQTPTAVSTAVGDLDTDLADAAAAVDIDDEDDADEGDGDEENDPEVDDEEE